MWQTFLRVAAEGKASHIEACSLAYQAYSQTWVAAVEQGSTPIETPS